MNQYFDIFPAHCQGNSDLTITSSGILYSIGEDDLIFSKNLKTNEEKRQYLEATDGAFLTIAATHNNDKNCIIAGANRSIQLVANMSKDEMSLLYMMSTKIEQITFSRSGKCLGVASTEGIPAFLDMESKNLTKCRPGHIEYVTSVFFSHNEKYLCSTGADGYLRLYLIENEHYKSPQLKFECKISADFNRPQKPEQSLRGMFNPSDTIIACPGKPFLQVIESTGGMFHETYKMSIRHEKQITICHWMSNNILLTGGLDNTLRVWNYSSEELIVKISNINFSRIVTYENTFYGINNTGSIYKFNKPQLIQVAKEEAYSSIPVQARQNGNQNQNNVMDNQSIDFASEGVTQKMEFMEVEDNLSENNNKNKKINKSKADKIINCYPQDAVSHHTNFIGNSRFLFYNSIGCITELKDKGTNEIEIQYHDRSIISKRKSVFSDREMTYFDLKINRLAFANEKEFGFFGNYQWERRVKQEEEIQGVALGNNWMAVALDGCFVIYDLAGNFMSSISFDRKFVAMAAYEDILAFAYIDSVPMFGCQNIRMNIWNINGVVESMESICVSLRPSSVVKAFGFSEEGLLYCQDSHDWIRVFNMQAKKWVDIFNPQQTVSINQRLKYWIVGISNYELHAFQLQEDEPEPSVVPRSIPRRTKISIPNPHDYDSLNETHKNQKGSFGDLLWKRLVIEHQRFRHSVWYRYKFARTEHNENYQQSSTILSEEELNIREAALEVEMLLVVKNLALQKQAEKAFITAKTFLKSEKQIKKVIMLFNQSQLPELATRLEHHFQETQRLQQYDLAQRMKLKQLQQDMEQGINFRPLDQMSTGVCRKENLTNNMGLERRSIKDTLSQSNPSALRNSMKMAVEETLNEDRGMKGKLSPFFQQRKL